MGLQIVDETVYFNGLLVVKDGDKAPHITEVTLAELPNWARKRVEDSNNDPSRTHMQVRGQMVYN